MNILNPFPDNSQQSTSFIQQSIFFRSGTYRISVSYISRTFENYTQLNILIGNVVIGTFGNNPLNASTTFSQQFTILNNAVVLFKINLCEHWRFNYSNR